MTKQRITVHIRVKIAWWVKLYMAGIQVMIIFGFTPDADKVAATLAKGIKTEVQHD